jgi:ABC-type nitrate/sulfonate/bicarbonate transport system substrate-binding protein
MCLMLTAAPMVKVPPPSSRIRAHHPHRASRALGLGYVPLLDSAPLIVAHELGFFEREGVSVNLRRQPGWASLRDKMLYGTLQAANAPAGCLYAINAGAAPAAGRCLSAFVTSAQGNAITLARRLHDRGIRSVDDLRAEVRARGSVQLTFGIVSPHSSHAHLLRLFLQRGGMEPDKDVRVVVLPPQQMVDSLAAGHIDGFCAGEPWNTFAVREGLGWIAADSGSLAPLHPEKVFLVHEALANDRHDEHMGLLRGLQQACQYCAEPNNRDVLIKLMLRWVFVDIPEKVLAASFDSPLAPIFSHPGLHAPTPEKARWVLAELRRHQLASATASDAELLSGFREDLYELLPSDELPLSAVVGGPETVGALSRH